MALSLKDFNTQGTDMEQLRMNAFQPRSTRSPAANSATINSFASLGAALEPNGNLDGAYSSITNELSYSASSSVLEGIIGQWDKNDTAGVQDSLQSMLADPNIPDTDKQAALAAFQQNKYSNLSIPTRVAMSAAEADSGSETVEASDLRAMIAAGYDEVDNYNAWSQTQLNNLNSMANPNFAVNLKTLINSMVPFVDQADAAMFESIAGVEGTGSPTDLLRTLTFMGEGKNNMREALDRMPVSERKVVVQNLINTIKSMQGPITTNEAVIKSIYNLEQMISAGGYQDRWVDDAFSVLDLIGIGTAMKKGVGALGDAMRGGKTTRLNEEVLRRGELAATNAAKPDAPLLQIEYKPTPVSYGDEIEDVINNLSVEPTSKELNEIREAINVELGNPDGFSIDNVINNTTLPDRMTGSQIIDLRQSISPIQIKRRDDMNGIAPQTSPMSISVDDVINNLPVEPTGDEIANLRALINSGATSDDVINNALVVDKLTGEQIANLRISLADVRMREPRRTFVSSGVQPSSIANIYKDVNPSKARLTHNMIVNDKSGRAAEVLAGTDRNSVIGNDILPDIGGGSRIRNKVEHEEFPVTPDNQIVQNIKDANGAIYASRGEKARNAKAVINDWQNLTGLSPRTAMQTIADFNPKAEVNSAGVSFNQVYGPKESGFKDGLSGMEYVKVALKDYGIKDTDLTLLARQKDGMYAPIRKGQDLRDGDFLVQVKYDYDFDPTKIGYDGFDVSKLWKFIPIPDIKFLNKEGGIVQQIIPKFVNIDKNAYQAGVSAADKAAGFQKELLAYGERMATGFKKLNREQRDLVDQYIRFANREEIPFSPAKIKAAGISEDGLKVLSDWKTVQDTMYVLENADVNKTLRNRGYRYYINKATDTQLLVKKTSKADSYGKDLLQPDGKIAAMSNKQIDDLYEAGGYVATLRKPEKFNGETITHVVVKDTPTEGYARAIRDDDATLGYRHGYYHVKYTDTYYITKTENGVTRTIGRADSKAVMDAEIARLKGLGDGADYDWKYDRSLNMDARFDEELDVQFNSGRSAQRLRGQRLDRIGHDKSVNDMGMESPIDSMVRSIASVSNRTAFRDVIEGDKRRWLTSYKHLLPNNTSFKYPTDINAIRGGESGSTEARHAWRYIQSLEDGYGNMIDDAAKSFFNNVANVADRTGWGWAEKVGKVSRQAAKGSPSGLARFTAFRMFMSSAALAQLPLQLAPIVPILLSLNPTGIFKVARQMPILAAWHAGVSVEQAMKLSRLSGMSLDEMRNLVKDYELSGMSSAVNAHSFLSNRLAQLADKNAAQKLWAAANKPLDISQKFGFELGEQSVMTTVWMSERDRMLKRLKKDSLDATDREELTAKVRALTGDMNRGGDMPYNSNSLSVLMQFLQNPHKIASSLILGHRGLTGAERAKLAAGYTLTFGLPGIAVLDMITDKLIPADNVELRDAVKGGLTNIVLNGTLSALTGEKVAVDFADRLQPFSTEPLEDFVENLITLSIPEMIGGRAAPSLISEGGRVANFAKAVTDVFNPYNITDVNEIQQAALTFAQMFTGVSNTMKAAYAARVGQLLSAKGVTVDEQVSFMEALAKASGFQTMDEMKYWEGNMMAWEMSKAPKEDAKKWVDGVFSMYTREGLDPKSLEASSRILSQMMLVYGDNPQLLKIVSEEYKMRLKGSNVLKTIMDMVGITDPADINRVLNNTNLEKEQKEMVLELQRIVGEAYGS